jgi:hypothetical protein
MKTVLACVALGLSLLGGCGAGSRSPEGVVRAFAEASEAGDREAVYRLLGPRTRARLDTDARRAAQLSGRRTVPPPGLLAVGWLPPRWHVRETRELERDGDHAVVEARGAAGEAERVECVRVQGAWRIELP